MRLIITVVLLLCVLSACGPETGPDDRGMTSSAPAGEYVVTSVTVAGSPHALVAGSEARLTFDDGKLGITAGCNHLFGEYSVDGETLTVGTMGGTEMGCPEPLMAQDAWLAAFFGGEVTIGRDPVTLTSGDTVLTLTLRAEVSPDRPLVGTSWTLDGVIEGDAVSSVPAGPDVVLAIESDTARVTGLCNGFGAEVTIADGTITWEPGMRTLMACADDARNTLDTSVAAVLTGPTSYEIVERRLTITLGDRALVFQAR